MNFQRRLVLCYLIAFGLYSSPSVADVFQVPLSFTTASSEKGEYVSADFDLGTELSQLESLTLQLVLPSGYDGFFASTSNSSHSRLLYGIVHEGDVPESDDEENLTASFPTTVGQLSQTVFHVPAGIEYELRYWTLETAFGADALDPVWPEFLYSGRGTAALVEMVRTWFHPMPSGDTVSSSTIWQSPPVIESASLTVVGTAVPEPAGVALLVTGVLALLWTARHASTKWRTN